jgi:hypothetical protein
MSNDNQYERLWKLQAKANMLILDGKRDINLFLSFYQRFLEASSFSPATFIGKDWSYDAARDPRSAALGLLDDYNKVALSTKWLEGQKSVSGEVRRRRILADTSSIPLHCDHFLDLWNNQEKIPESWKTVGVITFDGDVLRGPDGDRCVLYLCWLGGEWDWRYGWLDGDQGVGCPSAGLAS